MTNPTYNPNIPQPKTFISDSQDDFLNNFQAIYNAFQENHVPLDAASNAGNHTYLELLQQAANSEFQSDIGEINIYTKNVEGQTDQIFLKYPNLPEIQFTNFQIYPLNQTPQQTTYITFLPGKILVYFGMINPNNNPFDLQLFPYVAKVITGVNLCPIGTTTTNNPLYPLIDAGAVELVPGIFGKIQLVPSFGTTLPSCYYIVFANI